MSGLIWFRISCLLQIAYLPLGDAPETALKPFNGQIFHDGFHDKRMLAPRMHYQFHNTD